MALYDSCVKKPRDLKKSGSGNTKKFKSPFYDLLGFLEPYLEGSRPTSQIIQCLPSYGGLVS